MPSMLKGIFEKQGLQGWSEERFAELKGTYYDMISQLDERYLRRAEDQLYGELAVALGIDRQEVCQYIQKDYPAWPEE